MARKLLLEITELGLPAGDRIPRPDHPAIHRGPDQLGGDRRAHHGIADASRNGQRPVDAGRFQERHRRQRCRSRSTRCSSATQPHSFLGIDQDGSRSIVAHDRQSRRPRRLARRPRRDRTTTPQSIARRGSETGSESAACRQAMMVDCSHANSGKDPPRSRRFGESVMVATARRAARNHHGRHAREQHPPAGNQLNPRPVAAQIRRLDHRRLHQLGNDRRAAGPALRLERRKNLSIARKAPLTRKCDHRC